MVAWDTYRCRREWSVVGIGMDGVAVMAKVRVRILPDNREMVIEIDGRVTGERLLQLLGLSRESYIILVRGSPIPESEEIGDDEVVLVRVVSGGQV